MTFATSRSSFAHFSSSADPSSKSSHALSFVAVASSASAAPAAAAASAPAAALAFAGDFRLASSPSVAFAPLGFPPFTFPLDKFCLHKTHSHALWCRVRNSSGDGMHTRIFLAPAGTPGARGIGRFAAGGLSATRQFDTGISGGSFAGSFFCSPGDFDGDFALSPPGIGDLFGVLLFGVLFEDPPPAGEREGSDGRRFFSVGGASAASDSDSDSDSKSDSSAYAPGFFLARFADVSRADAAACAIGRPRFVAFPPSFLLVGVVDRAMATSAAPGFRFVPLPVVVFDVFFFATGSSFARFIASSRSGGSSCSSYSSSSPSSYVACIHVTVRDGSRSSATSSRESIVPKHHPAPSKCLHMRSPWYKSNLVGPFSDGTGSAGVIAPAARAGSLPRAGRSIGSRFECAQLDVNFLFQVYVDEARFRARRAIATRASAWAHVA